MGYDVHFEESWQWTLIQENLEGRACHTTEMQKILFSFPFALPILKVNGKHPDFLCRLEVPWKANKRGIERRSKVRRCWIGIGLYLSAKTIGWCLSPAPETSKYLTKSHEAYPPLQTFSKGATMIPRLRASGMALCRSQGWTMPNVLWLQAFWVPI